MAGGCVLGRPVWVAVNCHPARSTDALTTVGVERHRLHTRVDQPAVEKVEEVEHAHLPPGVIDAVFLVSSGVVRAGLAPDAQSEPHGVHCHR